MKKSVLFLTAKELAHEKVGDLLIKEGIEDLEMLQVHSVPEAENLLFEKKVYLLVGDWEVAGVSDFILCLKNDEMFRMLPVLLIIPDDSPKTIKGAFLCGADGFFPWGKSLELLAWQIRPLLTNNVLNMEMLEKISDLQEQAIQKFILLDLIKSYIPKTVWDIANEFSHQQRISIPEEEMELTVVFADIKEFTRLTQHLKPKEVIRGLNSMFSIVTDIVYQNGGDVDKFIGDAFFGVFKDAGAAVRSMVLIQNQIEELNRRRGTGLSESILFRIGIHTGPVIRGNVGGTLRCDNTLIGDTVNTASRLEHIAEPGGILISEQTRRQAGITVPETFRRSVQLRGKEGEEFVYSVYPFLKDKPI